MFASSVFLALALSATQPLPEKQCGADRWLVKLAADADASKISSGIADSSVRELARLPIPEVPYPSSARLGPHELTRYRLTAVIVQKRQESDGDLHVVLQHPRSSDRMIVEVPRDDCAQASRFRKEMFAARLVLQSAKVGTLIEVIGIGFFDFIHPAFGAAPNGFELHPVIYAMPVESQLDWWHFRAR